MTSSNSNIPKPLHLRQKERIDILLVQEEFELTEWEETFLNSLQRQVDKYSRELSEKQLAVLEKIEDAAKNGRPTR
jgi:hypothetical protein